MLSHTLVETIVIGLGENFGLADHLAHIVYKLMKTKTMMMRTTRIKTQPDS